MTPNDLCFHAGNTSSLWTRSGWCRRTPNGVHPVHVEDLPEALRSPCGHLAQVRAREAASLPRSGSMGGDRRAGLGAWTSPAKSVGLSKLCVDAIPRSGPRGPEHLPVDAVAQSHPSEGGQAEASESGVTREFLHRVTGPGPERLVEQAPDRVEELLPHGGWELCELFLRAFVRNISERHASPSTPDELLMSPIKLPRAQPLPILPALLELREPLWGIVVLQQIHQKDVPGLSPRLPCLKFGENLGVDGNARPAPWAHGEVDSDNCICHFLEAALR